MLALVGVWLAAIASPGPDLFQIIRLGSKSRAAGVACAIGIMIGNAIWIIASLVGLSALLQAVPDILAVLQIVGGAYLVWMGLGGATLPHREVNTSGALRTGILTNLSNPKAVLFFGAVFAQFVRPGMGAGAMVAIALTLILIGLAWFVFFALAVRWLVRPIEKYGHIIDIVSGIIFVALGVWMLWEGFVGLSS
ncbi:LysE family translocator [Corynebacterium sanguinis]|uniref:LysE family translocator n=2 Tax=Corynebacterium TaxID=1716 RepID=A0A6C1TZI8_9CORY|nr:MULTISPECIES: LysE family translocator [Corynebacterium]EEI16285.1 translocator protein, LysE family [Corynebacterium lipophiloflavum DSM 44291]MBA4504476.1 LysE family translocator [Corynebacterium sanguinis]MCT1412512.1 LysE family translocator [Corynebacterium sanguinis]MCT1443881.1 LysE family translocator [Corynebacterium sanguinis]MCT1492998.1 LysE family translocator [Corynebacterium sanguinis]